MCDNNGVLIVFIVLKAIILFVVPILIFVMYKKNSRLFTIVGIIELVCIIAMILLRLFGNDCIKNSNITYIKGNNDNTILIILIVQFIQKKHILLDQLKLQMIIMFMFII